MIMEYFFLICFLMHYVDALYIEPSMHAWYEAYLIMVNYVLNVFLASFANILLRTLYRGCMGLFISLELVFSYAVFYVQFQ